MPFDAWTEFFDRAGAGFYNQYIPLAIVPKDIILVVPSFIALYLFKCKIEKVHYLIDGAKLIFIGLLLIASLSTWTSVDSVVRGGTSSLQYAFKNRFLSLDGFLLAWSPMRIVSNYGIILTSVASISNDENVELTDSEIREISQFVKNKVDINSSLQPDLFGVDQEKNLIFILVESFLSKVSDLRVGDFEITPNLNRLRQESKTYYNGSVVSNVGIGESSDGQFIYMSGLLPLRGAFISMRKDLVIKGLPSLLRKKGYSTMITIPSLPSEWHQTEMSYIYGIESMNSSIDVRKTSEYIADLETFNLAIIKEGDKTTPFFHMILTADMHAPYKKDDCTLDLFWPEDFNESWRTYLSRCYETDRQIGRYIESLKKRNLYDESLIVIAADHQAHSYYLNMDVKDLDDEHLPLYIINSNAPKESFYHGVINQLDVYSTLNYLFGLSYSWTGLGNNLLDLNPGGSSVTDKIEVISDKIIKSNYLEALK